MAAKKKSATSRRKKAARKRPARKSPATSEVRVRVARLGFGECQLLTFPKTRGGQFSVLIDCGTSTSLKGSREFTRRVIDNISKYTRKRIDLLVITSPQPDHASGLLLERKRRRLFDDIEIRDIWLPWTEDPAEPSAGLEERQKCADALLAEAQVAGVDDEQLRIPGTPGIAGKRLDAALDYLRKRATGKVEYLRPGERRSLAGVAGVSAFVLGPVVTSKPPPPSRIELGDPGETSVSSEEPFDESFRIEPIEAKQLEFFQNSFGFADLLKKKDLRRLEWRQLDVQGRLDLRLKAEESDKDANEASLALAFHLEKSKRVLLFPSNARGEGWAEWRNLSLKSADGTRIKSDHLLSQCVLLKVGRKTDLVSIPVGVGPELLTNDQLVAIIPADRETAEKHRWDLPKDVNLEKLWNASQGRVIRTDSDSLPSLEESDLSKTEQDAFVRSYKIDSRWIEATVAL